MTPTEQDIAFRRYFNATYPRVKAYLSTVLDTNLHVDDIAQEVYIKLWNNWERVDHSTSPDGYLFTIVRHTIISHFRSAKNRKTAILPENDAELGQENNSEDKLQQKEYLHIYEQTLQTLHTVKQRCFRLHWDAGLTYRQIADQEGISVKTVERYIREIKTVLRTKLDVRTLYVILLLRIFS
ncbi:RNA polymerase sigma factor [Chitinophaga sp. GCM10012297]|uniref:Sigma-70 family RNA polymerase sigma factor n=1 Tax=Chitinophaga chungangae TaxID=2821488 RepID=A0ABS3YHT7_9BACT|nr:sigma-70 family RNA polymerase sigma factor [Chitinophaga chungangae]MBO9154257.1 sigma-70 family RNA polymerase sigma factor [Chitinophaga chungangae]